MPLKLGVFLVALFAPALGNNTMAIDMNPQPNPAAVVEFGHARFTVLSPAMIRMEWSPEKKFEDRASLVFINRHQSVPNFDVTRDDMQLTITTDDLLLTYKEDGEPFHADNLRVTLSAVLDGEQVNWTPGMAADGNLRGTARTLDGVSGSIPLESGLLSRDGWTVVDDSKRLLFDGSKEPWVTVRDQRETIDWYFMGYGRDYRRWLKDFTRVAGRIPLPPRYTFGAWWSRYWAYTADELKALVRQHREHDVPLDVLVIDIDWHLAGWTGYTWDPDRFPDPAGFLKWVDEQGLQTTLNLHPHEGVGEHEAMFAEFAKAVGRDPKKIDRVPFNCTDRQFMKAYFDLLHHPYEKMGVDFWWLDWQQGEDTDVPGLDPLWWLNHLHWTDMEHSANRGDKRPLIFSRWGGLGNHRYQIGFSGDTYCNWASLAFQPYFTSTAGNVGFGYWSHDIGGHQPGPVGPELYTRWVQFGAFSPALRTHTTKNPAAERRIWKFPPEYFHAMRDAYHLRYELLPYIYTAARQCYDQAIPLCRPLYYHWPEQGEAYRRTGQYMFGDDLLVAPVTAPANEVSGYAEKEVWLPPGKWVNWFTGTTVEGPAVVMLQLALDEFPVFVRAGAVVPTMRPVEHTNSTPVDPLVLNVFPGEEGYTEVYEDDGLSNHYEESGFARTPVAYEMDGVERRVSIGPESGSFEGMLKRRAFEVRFRDVPPPYLVSVNGVKVEKAKDDGSAGWHYDPASLSTIVRVPATDVARRIDVAMRSGGPDWKDFGMETGLRGVLRRIGDVAGMLSAERRGESGEAQRRLEQGTPAGQVVELVRSDWFRLLEALQTGAVKESVRPLARLLNLGFRTDVIARDEGQSGFVVRTGLTAQLPFADMKPRYDLAADIEWEPAANWRFEGDRSWHCARIPAEEPAAFETVIVPEGALQTAILKGQLTLHGAMAETGAEARPDGVHHFPAIPIRKVLLPSINRWWIVGPFDAPDDDRLQMVLPPEQNVDLDATYQGKGNKSIGWRRVERDIIGEADLSDEFYIEFHKVFDEYQQNAVAYALTWLHAPREMDVVLAVGSDDGNVVWLNGEEVFRHDVGRPYLSREDRMTVRLHKGANELLVKISQGGGMWGFSVHVEDSEGEPQTEVKALLEP